MSQDRPKRLALLPVIIAAALVVLILGAYAVARFTGQGEILGSVTVLDTQLGGNTPAQATDALGALQDLLANQTAPVTVQGAQVSLLPIQTGFELNVQPMVEKAMMVGRSPNPVSNFWWWITHIGRTTRIEALGSVDDQALDQILGELDTSIIGSPPFPGSIELSNGDLVVDYPRSGLRIDRAQARELLLEEFLSPDRQPADLPVTQSEPALTRADLDRARQEAELMLSAPVVLVVPDGSSLTFTVADLQKAFRATVSEDPAGVHLGFDAPTIEQRLDEVRSQFEAAPIDARFEIDGYDVKVIPGHNGTLIDGAKTADVLARAAHTSLRRAELPLEEGAAPEVTTEELDKLDIKHLVSEFTTYHPCCQPRVTNIHLIADKIDGAIVAPGETFSLNDYVGQRTAEDGFLPDGTIISGEIVDTVGGGVSQFATTFYNAVFWGGYEDVTHKPHSFYFSRYPEGIEATISWPQPDLAFRNDQSSGVLIKTEYTDTSITVQFYGDNDGRILSGNQSNDRLSVQVVAEGGPDARQVKGDRSDRFDYRDPPDPDYRPNPDLEPDDEEVVQSAAPGWSLTVTRTITYHGTTTSQEWHVRYLPKQEIVEVNPCKVPDSDEPCPTTTTTTSTTSTTVPPTTEPTSTTSSTTVP